MKKLVEKVDVSLSTNGDFNSYFKSYVRKLETLNEFESTWKVIISDFRWKKEWPSHMFDFQSI